jgi:HAE1 family hydrophobic/amphiphilic exporter-1
VSLSEVAIRRPIFTTMMSFLLVVLGLTGLSRLGTDFYPDVSMPFVMITTVYPGAGPEDVESQVSRPIEDAVAGISGVKRVTSQSFENVSSVWVEFYLSVDGEKAVQQVRDKVGIALRDLPRDIEPPVISRYDTASQPILVLSLASDQSALDLREMVDRKVRPRLEQLPGVAAARVLGGQKREVAVDLFPERLQSLGLSPDAVVGRIRAQHLELPGGRYPSGAAEVDVRVRGKLADIDALRKVVLAPVAGGGVVRLEDVALVREGIAEPKTLVRTNGRGAVAIELVKQPGSDTMRVAAQAKALLAKLESELGHGLKATPLIDQSLLIEANADEVWIAIFFGGAMAILIILFFLLDLRGTLISALALPTSVVGTFFAMWALGYSLNQLTLLGLSLAIGLLIDDAVVVRESITQRLEAGEEPSSAALKGTQEIALAVLATTLTLVAVFVPVAFMEGAVGRFFRQFGITITCAVLISLFVAFTLDPMLSARVSKRHHLGAARAEGSVARSVRAWLAALDLLFAKALDFVLHHQGRTAAAAAAVFALSLAIGSGLGAEFFAVEDRGQLVVNFEFPAGTRLATTSERSAQIEAQALALPGVTSVYAVIGANEESRRATWRVNLVDKRERAEGIGFYKKKLRELFAQVPQASVSIADPPILEGLGEYPPIYMVVTGPDFSRLREEATAVANALRSTPGAADVKILDSPGKPELQVRADPDASARYQVPAASIALQVRLATLGEIAGKLGEGAREAAIRVRLSSDSRDSREHLADLKVWGPLGPVALSQVASLESGDGPAIVYRSQRERMMAVSANVAPGANLGSVASGLRQRLAGRALPPGYALHYEGQQQDMDEMARNMLTVLGLALIFIYMVLASQFESLIHPFTIMFSLPLALVGAVVALAMTGSSLGMGANIGIILLMGLVTKNAILLIDGALQHMREGDDPLTAIRKSGPRRLRPILMTSAAMVLGMLPTALGRGIGSEFRAPMAIAVIGGVLSSTVLTLLVVPVVFLWVERNKARALALVRRRTAASPSPITSSPFWSAPPNAEPDWESLEPEEGVAVAVPGRNPGPNTSRTSSPASGR